MSPNRSRDISKFLSYHLRHAPHELGLSLEEGGWVSLDQLIQSAGWFSREEVEDVVRESDKQRFAIDASGRKIRANQGHSVEVELQLEAQNPPDRLYHGTARRFVDSIRTQGLLKGQRHHVHLSADLDTARKVGQRRGPAVILTVDSASMAQAGHVFFLSSNGVWLVDHVPPQFLAEG